MNDKILWSRLYFIGETGVEQKSLAHAEFGPLFAANAAAALVRRVGSNGVLDIHHSNQLQVSKCRLLARRCGTAFNKAWRKSSHLNTPPFFSLRLIVKYVLERLSFET